jgi:ABC-type branched-subunit amino acid transport system substrate-binding protein
MASRCVEDISQQLAGQAQRLRQSVGHFLGVIRQEPGVMADSITFGQSAALTGMTQALGCGIKDGLEAAFDEANATGGVGGRRLVLRSFDDEYEPAKAIANVRAMMRDGSVFAVLGSVGTPTAKATEPVTSAARMPFLAPMTGAAFLRTANNRMVINLRASYGQETEALVAHLVDRLGLKRIAVFLQNDAYGHAGLAGVTAALEKRGLSPQGRGSYERNTTAVERGLAGIRRARPQAVVLVGTYAACAAFIRQARQVGMNILFANLSFVASLPLRDALGEAGRGVLVSQVVPLPTDHRIPVVAHYVRALAGLRRDIAPDFISLEGYLAGRFAVEALRRIDGPITRETFLEAIFTSEPYNFDGFILRFAEGRNQGSDTIYLTEIGPDGAFRSVG